MINDDMNERLVRIFREELRQPSLQITSRTTQDDVAGWDSTAMASIIMSIEEEFGFELAPNELRNLRNVGDFQRIIAQHAE
jgi:acyl carrier protein